MKNVKILFEEVPWENPKTGVCQKIHSVGKKRIRLIRFEHGFVENDWCTNGHRGYVLCGSMTIEFNGDLKTFTKGDGLWIEAGESYKHKVIMPTNGMVELVLFEEEI